MLSTVLLIVAALYVIAAIAVQIKAYRDRNIPVLPALKRPTTPLQRLALRRKLHTLRKLRLGVARFSLDRMARLHRKAMTLGIEHHWGSIANVARRALSAGVLGLSYLWDVVVGRPVAQLRNWWAAQLMGWDAMIADKPAFAREFPKLSVLFGGLRQFATARTLAIAATLLFAFTLNGTYAFAMGPIRYLGQYSQIQTLAITPATDNGVRKTMDLENGRATRFFQVRVSASVDIAVANGTGVRNLGLAEALFSEIGIQGGGDDDIVRGDPLLQAYASEWMLAPSATVKTRLTSPNIGTTSITSQFRIWMENPRAAVPRETQFVQLDKTNRLQLFATLKSVKSGDATSSPGCGAIITGAAGTVTTLTNVSVRCQQIENNGLLELPLFRVKVSQVVFPIAAAANDVPLNIPLAKGEILRGLTLGQFNATEMESAGTMGQFTMKDDVLSYFGGGIKLSTGDYARGQSYESGGDCFNLYGERIIHFDFQREGKLSNCYNGEQGGQLQILADITAPAAGYQIVCLKHSLVRDERYRGVAVATTLPPDLAAPAAA